ncbi:MAG: sugar transferase [Lentimicrobiaceae bacterium]|jgi:exopolysaccharide biosynthesis polyprenyl glycosylphosphotransferase|nr:sugar transferase [Lentimicrobiaceae bacterium]MDD4598056.1 sugar transferase [Lentimicrobiaceae bacterium]MDY0025208.1 sugar transferase [Lentimicrobium sp.]
MIAEREDLSSKTFTIIVTIISLLVFIASFFILRFIRSGDLPYSTEYLTVLLMFFPIWMYGLDLTNLTRFYRSKDITIIFTESLIFTTLSTILLTALVVLFQLKTIDLTIMLIFGLLELFILNLMIMLSYFYHKSLLDKGMNTRNIILIADQNYVEFIEKIMLHNEWGVRLVTIISSSQLVHEIFGSRVKVIEQIQSLPYLLKNNIVDEVFYCKNDINQDEIQNLVFACEEIGVVFRLQSAFFKMSSTQTELNYFDNVPFLSFTNTPANKTAHQWKTVVDIVGSGLILLIWSPFLLIIAILIKLTSRGPVIFKQRRIGLRGREFNIYKFRTMVQDAEKLRPLLEAQNEMDGPVFKIKNDPRITFIGRILRKTGLDEVPQFFNVLKGDMSLVGPRPPLASEVAQYQRWQLRRLSMRPGITCIWQIAPNRNEITFDEWMKLDLQYIDSWSLKIDFLLILKTVQAVIRGSGQ